MRPTFLLPWLLALAMALGVAAIAGVVVRNVEQTRTLLEDTQQVSSTIEVQRQLDEILLRSTEAETGQRGFLLTREADYLDTYHTAVADIPLALDRLETLTRATPAQLARLVDLRATIDRKLTELARTIDVSERDGTAAAVAVVRSDDGRQTMERLRQIVAEMSDEEARRLASGREQAQAAYLRARRGRIGSGLLSALLLIGVALLGVVLLRVRERSARQIDDERERLSVTLASIGDGVIATDVDGRVSLLNSVAEGLTGYQADDAVGRPLVDIFSLVDETTGAPLKGPIADVLTTGRQLRVGPHTTLVSRGGRRYPIDASAAPIRTGDGDARGAVVLFRDVSSLRAHEQTIADSEARYRDAAAQAQSARTEAEQANRLKDEFLAILSHELRTPLNAVLGWAQILLAGEPSPATMARGLASIKRNAEAQQRLVEDLLDVSRIVTGKFQIERRPTALRAVIGAAIDAISQMAAQNNVGLHAELSAGAIVDADPYRLQQVATNLLSNAVKFTPAGGQIDVVLTHVDNQAALVVRDTGHGIAPELLPHIFDRFRQGDGSYTRAYGGLGLGLAIARYIVESHGGTIVAASDGVGRGATFTVTLPAMDSLVTPRPARSVRAAYEGGGGGRLSGRRILVVEDEADARELISWALQEAGADVVVAADGVEALGLLSADRLDVVLTDVHMPHMDGFRLLGAMRERLVGSAPPAIAISARAGTDEALRAGEAGFVAHLTKPVDLNLLLDTIDRVMHA